MTDGQAKNTMLIIIDIGIIKFMTDNPKIICAIVESQMDGRKEQTPPAKVFSCQFGTDFITDEQKDNANNN